MESVDGRPLRLWQPDSGVEPTTRPSLKPLAVRPTNVSRREAADMLLVAVRGLPVARADRSLLVRAEATWDAADVVILASLLARARQLGSGRRTEATPATAASVNEALRQVVGAERLNA